MKLLPPLLAAKKRDLVLLRAYPIGPRQVAVAFEAYIHGSEKAATAIVTLDLDTLATSLVCEVAGSSIDYAHVGDWHGLLQPDVVVEFQGKGPPTVVKQGKSKFVRLTALARFADTTYVAGTRMHKGSASNGIVARVARGTLVDELDTAARGELGPFTAMHAGAKSLWATGGYHESSGTEPVYRSDGKKFGPSIPTASHAVKSLYEKADGTLMIGYERGNAGILVPKKPPQALTGAAKDLVGVTEFRGVDYWLATDGNDDLVLYKRSGTKLAKAFKGKARWVGYRQLNGSPNARMTASSELLVITNVDRLHAYDGKTWTTFGLQGDVAKLFKRLPTGIKR